MIIKTLKNESGLVIFGIFNNLEVILALDLFNLFPRPSMEGLMIINYKTNKITNDFVNACAKAGIVIDVLENILNYNELSFEIDHRLRNHQLQVEAGLEHISKFMESK